MSQRKYTPRSSTVEYDKPRFLNPSIQERNWIRTIPDTYPDIMRAPAVSYKPARDNERVKSNDYVAFIRPYKCRQGLLIIGKDHRPVIVDETEPFRHHIIPMRLDRDAIQGTWIFSISLYLNEGLIQLEDCIVADDIQIRSTEHFKSRFIKLERFSSSIWFNDSAFQLLWQIKVAAMQPLEYMRTTAAAADATAGGCLCLMPDSPTFRLLKVVAVSETHMHAGKPIAAPIAMLNEFICSPVTDKPDVYDLKNNKGEEMGRASIQTLSISQKLQQLAAIGQPIRVIAEWSADFESYVVISVL